MLLSFDFNKYAFYFHDDMAAIQAHAETMQGRHFLQSIPVWKPERWVNVRNNTCYNHALDVRTFTNISPGGLNGPNPFHNWQEELPVYAEKVHQGALKDGLIYLGESFRLCADIKAAPILSFYRDSGYREGARDPHWVAIFRRSTNSPELVVVHKLAESDARECRRDQNGRYDLFGEMKDVGYQYFNGCYGKPVTLAQKLPLSVKIWDALHA